MTEQATTATRWHLTGDWFDVCKCAIPCPCTVSYTHLTLPTNREV